MRELAGDIYFGEHELNGEGSKASARDVADYSSAKSNEWRAMRSSARGGRNRRVTSVDKANVLATSALWREP